MTGRTSSRTGRTTRTTAGRLLVAVGGAAAVVAAVAPAASADGNGTTATVTVATRSLTVSTASLALDACYSGGYAAFSASATAASDSGLLQYPNGFCTSSKTVTVTNGTQSGHVFVQVGDGSAGSTSATGNAGNTWTIASSTTPGSNQYTPLSNGVDNHTSQVLTGSSSCDFAFNDGQTSCTAPSNASAPEHLSIIGPSSSSGTSTTYSYKVLWLAVP